MLGEHAVARIALGTAIAGLAFLLLLSQWFEPPSTKIAGITEKLLGYKVRVNARVDSAFHAENFVLFELNDGSGKLGAIIFNPSSKEKQLLQKNSFVVVQGKVQLYKKELEIVAEKVEKW